MTTQAEIDAGIVEAQEYLALWQALVPDAPPPPPPPPVVIAIGSPVKVTEMPATKVRSQPGVGMGTFVLQLNGALGTVTNGPTVMSGVAWWFVNFATGADGWVAGDKIALA